MIVTKKTLKNFKNKLQKMSDEIQKIADECSVADDEAEGTSVFAEALWSTQMMIEDARDRLDEEL